MLSARRTSFREYSGEFGWVEFDCFARDHTLGMRRQKERRLRTELQIPRLRGFTRKRVIPLRSG